MLHGDVRSAHLRELLAFEAERHRLPLTYKETRLYDGWRPPSFRREAVVIAHHDYRREEFGLCLDDQQVLVKLPATLLETGQPIGYVDDQQGLVPLASIVGNHLLVHFSLEELAKPESILASRPGIANGNVLNKVFDLVVGQAMPVIKDYVDSYDWAQEKARYAGIRTRCIRARVTKAREDIGINEQVIETKAYEIRTLARKNSEIRDTIAALEAYTLVQQKKAAEEDFLALMAMVPDALRGLEVEDGRLVATTYPISIEWDSYSYDLGSFRIDIKFENDQVLISKHNGKSPEGYPHPHVSAGGIPCWGNVGVSLAKLLAEGQYPAALAVIKRFLASYNASDAYIKIEKWDPDWEDERWDRCYDDASVFDCVDCDDDSCPHHEDRYQRCFEHHLDEDIAACIRCRRCSYHEDAATACRDDASLTDCIECSEDRCRFAGREDDMDDCHDLNPGECTACQVTRCRYRGEEDDT